VRELEGLVDRPLRQIAGFALASLERRALPEEVFLADAAAPRLRFDLWRGGRHCAVGCASAPVWNGLLFAW